MTSLADAVVLVTGATGGIGRAVCELAADRGSLVCLTGRDTQRLEELAGTLPDPARVRWWPADLATTEGIASLADSVNCEVGGVDVLVHALGTFARGSMRETLAEDLDACLAVNVRAPYLLTRALLPGVLSHRGQVVFVNSTAGLAARAGVSAYAASKHALKGVADALREEVNSAGVRVLSVFPGRTATPMQERVAALEATCYRPETLLQPADVAMAILGALELPRTAELTNLTIRPMCPPTAPDAT